MKHCFMATLMLSACTASEGGGDPAGATLVGRIQGTEFLEPDPAAAIWLENEGQGLAALRLSEGTDGCGAPDGWSLLVQVNLMEQGHYDLGPQGAEPGKGFLAEDRREDGSLDMPSQATGTLDLTAKDEHVVAGSLVLLTSDTATLTAVFEAPVCPATALITP